MARRFKRSKKILGMKMGTFLIVASAGLYFFIPSVKSMINGALGISSTTTTPTV